MSVEFEIENKNVTPPGGWIYTQPESGRTFKHYAYNAFMDLIREHRLGNGYPMSADWQEEIVDNMCRNCPACFPDTCKRKNRAFKVRRFSFGATMSFGQMLWKWLTDGRPLVEQEEAERRAAICAQCPYNQQLAHSCGACFSKMLQIVAKLVGDRKTKVDDKLGQCGICSCALRASVHFPLEAQQANLTEDIKNDFKTIDWCWKKENL